MKNRTNSYLHTDTVDENGGNHVQHVGKEVKSQEGTTESTRVLTTNIECNLWNLCTEPNEQRGGTQPETTLLQRVHHTLAKHVLYPCSTVHIAIELLLFLILLFFLLWWFAFCRFFCFCMRFCCFCCLVNGLKLNYIIACACCYPFESITKAKAFCGWNRHEKLFVNV